MTQWEEMKKEYHDIPIPADGPCQMLAAVAKAKQQRRKKRLRSMTKYATIAAAVLVVVLLVPGMLLLSGGFAAKSEDSAMSMKQDQLYHTVESAPEWYVKNEGTDNNTAVPEAEAPSQESSMDNAEDSLWDILNGAYENGSNSGETSDYMLDAGNGTSADTWKENTGQAAAAEMQKSIFAAPGVREAVSKEIIRQMEKRMQAADGTYYIKSETYPQGFEQIAEEQQHYINDDGLLVIVFSEGMVAPAEQGSVEFVIPASVFQP